MQAPAKHATHGPPPQSRERHTASFERRRRALSFARRILGAAGLALCLSCASLRVPSSIPEFGPLAWISVEREGLNLRAVPLEGRDRYWEIFDENLPSLGIVAVWVEIRNSRQTPVILAGDRWHLRTPAGTNGSLDARQVMERYYSHAGTRIYSTAAAADAQARLDRLLLASGDVSAGRSLAGFLFFAVDPSEEVRWSRNATLIAPPIRCAGCRAATIELPLAYATP